MAAYSPQSPALGFPAIGCATYTFMLFQLHVWNWATRVTDILSYIYGHMIWHISTF